MLMSKNGNAGPQGAVLACLTLLWCAGPVWSADQQTNFFAPEPFVHQEVKQQQIRSASRPCTNFPCGLRNLPTGSLLLCGRRCNWPKKPRGASPVLSAKNN